MGLAATASSGHSRPVASVEKAFQRSIACGVAVFWAVWAVITVSSWHGGTSSWSGGALVVLVWSVLVARGWPARLGVLDAWAAWVTSVLVLLLPVLGAAAVPSAARLMLVVVPAVLAAAFVRWPLAVVAAGSLTTVHLLQEAPGQRLETAVGTWPVAVGVLVVALVVAMLRRAAHAVEASHRDLARARERDALLQGRRRAHREHQRLLHDRVSTALRGLAVGGLSRDEALSLCRDAAGALAHRDSPPSEGTVVLATHLRQQTPSTRTPVVLDLDDAVVVPAPVAVATSKAVAEALRNIDRHARADQAQVGLSRVADGFVVAVRDDGAGLTAGARGQGFGIRESVVGRMDEVGGEVALADDPRGGTVVSISWEPGRARADGPPPSRSELMAVTVGGVRAPLAAVAATYLAGNAVVGALVVGDTRHPWALGAWFAALCAATGWLLVRGDRRVGMAAAVATMVALVVLEMTGLVLVPPDLVDTNLAWPVGAIGSALAVLAVLRPAWEPLVVAAATEVAVLVMVLAPGVERPPWLGVLTTMLSPLYGLVVGLVMAATLLGLARAVSADRAAQEALLVARAAAEGRSAIRGRGVVEVGGEVLPFLRGLLARPSDLGSARTRARAGVLGEQVRDELLLPGVLDAPARAALAVARSGGCEVRLRADADSVDLPGCINVALVAALADPPPRRLTLSVERSGATTVHLVLEPGGEHRGALLEAALVHLGPVVETGEESVVVELRG